MPADPELPRGYLLVSGSLVRAQLREILETALQRGFYYSAGLSMRRPQRAVTSMAQTIRRAGKMTGSGQDPLHGYRRRGVVSAIAKYEPNRTPDQGTKRSPIGRGGLGGATGSAQRRDPSRRGAARRRRMGHPRRLVILPKDFHAIRCVRGAGRLIAARCARSPVGAPLREKQ